MKIKFTKKDTLKSKELLVDTVEGFLEKVPTKHINAISEHSIEFLDKAKEQYTKKNMEWPGDEEFLITMFTEGIQSMLSETLLHLLSLDVIIKNNKKK